jgi:cytochrome P450
VTTTEPLYFEPFDPACREGIFDTYARLHREAPVRRCESGYWTVVRLDDIRTLYTRTDLFSNRPNGTETMRPDVDMDDPEAASRLGPVFDSILLDTKELLAATVITGSDPPFHTQIRKSVSRAFTRARIDALREFIDEEVGRCVRDIRDASRFDVINELAAHIPLRVMTRLFGLDPRDVERFRQWANAMAAQLDAEENRGSIAWKERHYRLIGEFADYFVPLMSQRAANPGSDLLSDIMAAEDDALSASEAVLFIFTLLGAGSETTTNLIGNVVVELMRHPDQLKMVIADPDLVPAAIEESLRYDSPFQFTFREAKVDVELSGVQIPAGSKVLNMLGAANRDPSHFADPDRFDITRKSQHMGFGQGIHFCLGAALARMEANAAVRALLPHLADFTLDEEGIVDRTSLLIWGRSRVPLKRLGT